MIQFKLVRRDEILSGARLENLKHFQKRNYFTDVIFICQDNLYHLHKLVLSSASNYARQNLLSADTSGSTIFMTGVHPHDVENIICFIYEGTVWLPRCEVEGFLKAAKILRIDCFEPNEEFSIPEELLYEPKPKPKVLQDSTFNISNNSGSRATTLTRTYDNGPSVGMGPNPVICNQENSAAGASTSSICASNTRNRIQNLKERERAILTQTQMPQVSISHNGSNRAILIRSGMKSKTSASSVSAKRKPPSKFHPCPEKFRRIVDYSDNGFQSDDEFDETSGASGAYFSQRRVRNLARLDTSYDDVRPNPNRAKSYDRRSSSHSAFKTPGLGQARQKTILTTPVNRGNSIRFKNPIRNSRSTFNPENSALDLSEISILKNDDRFPASPGSDLWIPNGEVEAYVPAKSRRKQSTKERKSYAKAKANKNLDFPPNCNNGSENEVQSENEGRRKLRPRLAKKNAASAIRKIGPTLPTKTPKRTWASGRKTMTRKTAAKKA